MPVTVLVDSGTSGPAELFAAALAGNKRAELIGERTVGRTGVQELMKLPDGSALWITSSRYLTPSGAPLQAKGLEPHVVVDQPEGDFGGPAPQMRFSTGNRTIDPRKKPHSLYFLFRCC